MATKRKYDDNGKWIALDARHGIAREGTGDLANQWAFRYCGDFVSSHGTKKEAEQSALNWEIARTTRLIERLAP